MARTVTTTFNAVGHTLLCLITHAALLPVMLALALLIVLLIGLDVMSGQLAETWADWRREMSAKE